jgi:hypothetical protein
VSSFVRDLWGANNAGVLQPASAPGASIQPAAASTSAQPSPASAPAAGANAAQSGGRVGVSLDPFQFLRPDAHSAQSSRPI